MLLNKYFFLQVTYKLLSQSRKPNNQEGRLGAGGPYKRGEVGKFFEKKARPTPLDNTTSWSYGYMANYIPASALVHQLH